MEAVHESFQTYIDRNCSEEPKLLHALNKETYQKTIQPYMLSGHYQGRLLALISKILRPKCIVELGTFTGYSTLCLAEGLVQEGEIHTVDRNDELTTISSKYFKKSDYAEQIHTYEMDALAFLTEFDQKIDLAFIDADKGNYLNYYEALLPKMQKGGVLLVDNVLWYGKVLEPAAEKDLDTSVLQKLNEFVAQDTRVEVIILPIRDGISLIRKK